MVDLLPYHRHHYFFQAEPTLDPGKSFVSSQLDCSRTLNGLLNIYQNKNKISVIIESNFIKSILISLISTLIFAEDEDGVREKILLYV